MKYILAWLHPAMIEYWEGEGYTCLIADAYKFSSVEEIQTAVKERQLSGFHIFPCLP